MVEKLPSELLAARVANYNPGSFLEMLNAETDEGRYEILAALLSYAPTFKECPLP
jgi:hypothetical protein